MGLFSRDKVSDEDGRALPARYNASRPITASAAKINLNVRADRERWAQQANGADRIWQTDAWIYYDAIGEVKFGFNLVSSVLSRLRIYAGVVVDPDAPPVSAKQIVDDKKLPGAEEDEDLPVDLDLAAKADEYVNALNNKAGAVSTMMRIAGLNLSVVGECYFVEIDGDWSCRSTDEVRLTTTGRVELRNSHTSAVMTQPRYLPNKTPIGRVWRQHPRYSLDADSSMKALRTDCEELLLLGRMTRSAVRARLNAGILFVPDTIEAAAQAPTDDPESGEPDQDPFVQELFYAMTQPVNDESSGSSVVPMLVRGPEGSGDKIKYITLGKDIDKALADRATSVLDRILQGIDVPKDVVTGLANVKYANAVQIDENLYKAHIEPLALMIVDALTEIYLRPMLRAAGFSKEDIAKIVIWYDPSEVVVRPDRGSDADNGYDRYLLSGDAWRRAHSFSDADAPDQDELAVRMALDKAVISDDQSSALFANLLPKLFKEARDADLASHPLPESLQSALDGTNETPPAPPDDSDPAAATPPPIDGADAATAPDDTTTVPDDASALDQEPVPAPA